MGPTAYVGTRAALGPGSRAVLAGVQRKDNPMNNDKSQTPSTRTQDPTTSDKPKVRVVDLDEVRDALGGAAPSSGGTIPTEDFDTTMCPW